MVATLEQKFQHMGVLSTQLTDDRPIAEDTEALYL